MKNKIFVIVLILMFFINAIGLAAVKPVEAKSFPAQATLAPEISISMPLLERSFIVVNNAEDIQRFDRESLGQTIQNELANAEAAMFSLENSFFVKDEKNKILRAELTGQRIGGLGRYMGDLLARLRDNGKKVMGVGLLYNYVMVQSLSELGHPIVRKVPIDRDDLQKRGVLIPIVDETGKQKTVEIEMLQGEYLKTKLWWAKRTTQTGEVYTLLLDNHDITSVLYLGETHSEERLRQSILLGKAGVKALEELGITPKYFHLNEGSAALPAVYAKESKSLCDVKITGVMHTPVEAGLPKYHTELLHKYFYDLGPEWEYVILDESKTFIDMTKILFRMSRKVAAVGQEFNDVLKAMVRRMYPERPWFADKIEPITNGVDGWVYQPALLNKERIENEAKVKKTRLGQIIVERKKIIKEQQMKEILRKQLIWYAIGDTWPELVQPLRKQLRSQQRSETDINKNIALAMQHVGEAVAAVIVSQNDDISEANLREILKKYRLPAPEHISLHDALEKIQRIEMILTDLIQNRPWLSYGRRFTKYKMDYPLLEASGIERIVNDLGYALVFAGISHPNDEVGKEWVRNVVELSKKHFGKVIFLPGYDLDLDRRLLQCADVWLYSPERLLEACGTSGMCGLFSGAIPVVSPTGWSLEYVEEFNPQTGKGNGFFIEPYPDPKDDDWHALVSRLKNEGWDGLYKKLKKLKDIIDSYYKDENNQIYPQLVENVYLSAEKTDMKIAAEKYFVLMMKSDFLIGTHTARRWRIEDIIDITHDNNFSAVELSFYPEKGLKSPTELDPEWVQNYLKPQLLDKFVTVHLPVTDLRENANLEKMKEFIDFAADIRAQVITIQLDELDDYFIEKVTKLVIYSASKGIKLGLENSYHIKDASEIVWHTPEHVNIVYQKIYEALAREGRTDLEKYVGFVFNLAHAKIAMKQKKPVAAFYRKLNKDIPILEVNVSGNKLARIGALERHIPVHDDAIVLQELPQIMRLLLKERNFKGPFILSYVGENLSKEQELMHDIYDNLIQKTSKRKASTPEASQKSLLSLTVQEYQMAVEQSI